MKKTKTSVIFILAALLLMLPFVIVHGAGGRIEGKVTDPKSAAVIGAAITVTDPISNQTFAAITDNDGRYKVEGLPPGTYAVTVSAKGFTDGRRDEVKTEEGATVTLDVKLDIAPIEAAVNVAAPGTIGLTRMVRLAGRPTLPIPSPLFGTAAEAGKRVGALDFSPDFQRLLRYGRGIDVSRLVGEIGFSPRHTTVSAVQDFVAGS